MAIKALSMKRIRPRMTNETFRRLGREKAVEVLRYLADHPGSTVTDVDYKAHVENRGTATRRLKEFVNAGWAKVDKDKRYTLTDQGIVVLRFADTEKKLFSSGKEGAGAV